MSQALESVRQIELTSGVVTAIISALVALLVGFLTACVTIIVARRGVVAQADLKSKELTTQADLKTKELTTQADLKSKELTAQADLKTMELSQQADLKLREFRSQSESMRQTQMAEVIKKRVEIFQILYEIITVYGRNWEIEGKARNQAWARSFLKALIDNNAKNGVFFSNLVYIWYGALRSSLEELTRSLSTREHATPSEIDEIYAMIRGVTIQLSDGKMEQFPGLGSFIKDELGSYVVAAVSATSDYKEEMRKLIQNPAALLRLHHKS